ncbi:trypsin-like peptidase domain-containing protein [Arthrobacter sp. CDRTa11]|nr:trypsin-like peptidase domain-containing protein [Arthrobacter sp. CDRTa11]
MDPMQIVKIALPSLMSLRIEMYWSGNHLATGTGFVVMHEQRPFLITNWHNLAGRDPETNEIKSSRGVTPDEVRILHNDARKVGSWIFKSEPLLDAAENPLWVEHDWGKEVDVVALSLTDTDGVTFYPYALENNMEDQVMLGPSSSVNIIGFPFAESSHAGIGIWARGTIASEMDLDYRDWPRFLIDSRTRPGQSGSPVMFYSPGGAVLLKSGTTAYFSEPIIQLLGVYSGRINKESDLGIVWKIEIIREVLSGSK